jgi:hypothetical protein
MDLDCVVALWCLVQEHLQIGILRLGHIRILSVSSQSAHLWECYGEAREEHQPLFWAYRLAYRHLVALPYCVGSG